MWKVQPLVIRDALVLPVFSWAFLEAKQELSRATSAFLQLPLDNGECESTHTSMLHSVHCFGGWQREYNSSSEVVLRLCRRWSPDWQGKHKSAVKCEILLVQALEPEADTAARKRRVAEALLQYKQQAGLVVDPQAEAAAKLAYSRGAELMQRVGSCPWG